jgi:dUTP pyrophosphatase
MATGNAKILRYKLLTTNAFPPFKKHRWSAGYNLKSPYDFIIHGKHFAHVKTDLTVLIPKGYFIRLAPLTETEGYFPIEVEVKILEGCDEKPLIIRLFNMSREDVVIRRGGDIAQLLPEKICLTQIENEPDASSEDDATAEVSR